MAIFTKDTVKLWVTTDQNYKQPLFERSDESLNTRERTDCNVCESGHAFLAANADVAYLVGSGVGANTDITTILGIYIEASDDVWVNCKTTSTNVGINKLELQKSSNGNAVAYLTCNVATASGTFDVTAMSGNANTKVSWVIFGV